MVYAGLALLFVAVAFYWLGWVNARRAEVAFPPRGVFLHLEGCSLHYVRQGAQGKRSSVVLLHGSDGFLQDFAPLLHEAVPAGYDLIAIDRPGHGYSEAASSQGGTLAEQVGLIHSALEQLGVARPILVGHSWSATLCLCYALEYPHEVAGLVLLSPWVYANADAPSPLLHAAGWIGRYLTHAFLAVTPLKRLLVRHSLKQAFFPAPVPPDYEREAVSLWLRSPAQIAIFLRENADAWARLPALAARYTQVTVPLVILTGDRDQAVHAQQHAHALHRALPHSELHVVLQTGHELPHLQPSLVLEAIIRCEQIADATQPDLNALGSATLSVSGALESEGDTPQRQARELVFRYGWNATAYQILNPDMLHWFTADGAAVVGYVLHFKTRVVAGAPLCDESRLAEVALRFEQDAAASGERVCWFAASTRLQQVLMAAPSHALLVIGAQPAWNPAHWSEIARNHASLRAQLNRAHNKGVVVSEWAAERASGDPGLQRCLDEWLTHHTLPTLHFLTEPVTLDRLMDRRIFVAEVDHSSVGFLIVTPVPSRHGWLVEQIVRGGGAPNGTSELLVDAAMRALAEEGFEYVTMGLVPLTQRERVAATPPRLWLRAVLSWARVHGRRFYNFEGLDAFKAKFQPESWEPLFALSNEPRVSPRTLMAILAAFSDGPLLWTAARALTAAALQEATWLRQRVKRKAAAKSPSTQPAAKDSKLR